MWIWGYWIECYRCETCGRLETWNTLKSRGRCICGSSRIHDGNPYPINIIEWIKYQVWKFKLRSNYEYESRWSERLDNSND